MLEIRDCASSDAEALFRLFGHWDASRSYDRVVFMASLEAVLNDPAVRIIVAEEGGAIVGYGQITERRKLGQGCSLDVDQLLVDESRRSGGIGKALMARIEQIARESGLGLVALHSQAHRSRAHVFYERLGYQLKKISKYYEKRLE
jgi:GNAT superfamily N-acetyltransferase